MTAVQLQTYEDPGKWAALVLAVLMHLLLGSSLYFTVRWQVKHEPVMVDVWVAPAPTPAPEVAENPENNVEAAPPPEATPPKEAPKPPPDIAIKDKKAKEEAKKKEPPPKEKARDPMDFFKSLLGREESELDKKKDLQAKLAQADAEKAMLEAARKDQEAKNLKASRDKATRAYTDKLKGKIRGNLIQPPNLKGNPVAQFVVTQLPSGEVLDVRLLKASGVAAYDEAIERAIRKSSPLPKPDDMSVFDRELKLSFCPDEERGCR